MVYFGLIKWFDTLKGFGKIVTPKAGEVFICQNDFLEMPNELLIGTPIFFERKDNRVVKARFPNSYEDFKLIVSHLKENPSLPIEVTITRKRAYHNEYISKTINHFNLINCSITKLLCNIKHNEILSFFKDYFDEYCTEKDAQFLSKYFNLTAESISASVIKFDDIEFQKYSQSQKHKIRRYSFEISSKKLLITQLFDYYLNKVRLESLFEIWKSNDNIVKSDRVFFNDKINFEFPTKIFTDNYSEIGAYSIKRILSQSNGLTIAEEIIDKKTVSLEFISRDLLNELLNIISLVLKNAAPQVLREKISITLVSIWKKVDLSILDRRIIESFTFFTEIIKNNNVNDEVIIIEFNKNISDEIKFVFWSATKYFNPDILFLMKYLLDFSYSDFLGVSDNFHREYISNRLHEINDYDNIENFGLLTFLTVETPLKVFECIFSKLQAKYKASYWLNFPKKNRENNNFNKSNGKYYEANYEISDMPFSTKNFVDYTNEVSSIEDLITSFNLVKMIQQEYNYNSNDYNRKGFFKLSEGERKAIIQELLTKIYKDTDTNEMILEIFSIALEKSETMEDSILLCKSIIPKFINEKNARLSKLFELVKERNNHGKSPFQIQQITAQISNNFSNFERVKLWYIGSLNDVDFKEVFEVFENFELNEQPILFRKLFSLVHKKQIIQLDLFRNSLFQLLKCKKLNLNVRICVALIEILHKQKEYIGENILSEIICNNLDENIDNLIQIDTLFQTCNGMTWITPNFEKKEIWYLNILGKEFKVENYHVLVNDNQYYLNNEKRTVEIEGEHYPFKWVKKVVDLNRITKLDKPKGVTFCDAIKSQKDEIINRNFYWCCNKRCYNPCQTDYLSFEWKSYSLRDFIKILGFPFEDDKYYRFVSVVNQANRLLEKLKCNSCNHLLRDARTSEFAFYRVTTFHCTNPNCSQKHKIVYLNHCLNWKCSNIVDSRISVTCPNGWYICDECDSCCSQSKIEKRLENLITNNSFNSKNLRHQKLKNQVENKLGHLELNELYDYHTGEKK